MPWSRRGSFLGVGARARTVAVVPLTSSPLFVQVQAQLLQLKIVLNQLLLLIVQLSQLVLVRRNLLSHDARGVAPKPLPLAGQLAALLPIVVQEAAEVAELLIVVAQPLIRFFQGSQFAQLWKALMMNVVFLYFLNSLMY